MILFLLATWIYLPRLANARLVVPGDSLVVLYGSGQPNPVSVRLEGRFVQYDLGPMTGTPLDTLWRAIFALPAMIEPGIYNIILSTPEGADTQPNALMVYPAWRDTVVFLQFSDIHIGNTAQELLRFQQAVIEANTIYPDFIVITGDIVEAGEIAGSPTWYGQFLAAAENLMVPVFTVNGNHDYSPATRMTNYPALINPELNYLFTYSDWLLMLCLDTGPIDPDSSNARCWGLSREQIAWADSVLDAHPGFTQKLAMMHGPLIDYDGSDRSNTHGRDEFIGLSLSHGLSLILHGHTHHNRFFLSDSTWVQGDVPVYPATPYFLQELSTCKNSKDTMGYKRIELSRDTVISFLEDQDRSGLPDGLGSLLLWNLRVDYAYNLDSTNCVVAIDNNSPRTFYGGRVWPTMNPAYEYEVLGPARIIRMAPGGFMEVAVDSIPSDDTTIIYIFPRVSVPEDKREVPGLQFTGKTLRAFPGRGTSARLSVYDATGRLISVLKEGPWEGPREFGLGFLKPGAYVAIMDAGNFGQRLVFVRR
ncbi:MAG: metallophosphoesterase family protein [candidate division WOR-3 bacterium]